jgi:hypothetical protein
MKQITQIKKSLFFIFSFFITISVFAQPKTEGTDFWVSFANNNNFSDLRELLFQIRVVANEETECSITFFESNLPVVRFTVPTKSVHTHTLTDVQKSASYNLSAGRSSKSIRIQSNKPVSVYALSMANHFADATILLPVDILGGEYFHLGRKNTGDAVAADRVDQYMAIAIQNNTISYENGLPMATLQRGNVYLRKAPNGTTDMSGYRITSNNPIAYFTAHNSAYIQGGGDNFFQQLSPVETWGKKFLVPVSNREIELVRIVASQNATTVKQTGGTVKEGSLYLNRGQWVE